MDNNLVCGCHQQGTAYPAHDLQADKDMACYEEVRLGLLLPEPGRHTVFLPGCSTVQNLDISTVILDKFLPYELPFQNLAPANLMGNLAGIFKTNCFYQAAEKKE